MISFKRAVVEILYPLSIGGILRHEIACFLIICVNIQDYTKE